MSIVKVIIGFDQQLRTISNQTLCALELFYSSVHYIVWYALLYWVYIILLGV